MGRKYCELGGQTTLITNQVWILKLENFQAFQFFFFGERIMSDSEFVMPRYAKLSVDSWEKKKNERKKEDLSSQVLRNNSVEFFFHIHKHQIFALPTSLPMHNAEWVAPCCIATVVCLSFLSVSLTHNLLPDRQFYKKVNRTFSQSWGVFVREEKWY